MASLALARKPTGAIAGFSFLRNALMADRVIWAQTPGFVEEQASCNMRFISPFPRPLSVGTLRRHAGAAHLGLAVFALLSAYFAPVLAQNPLQLDQKPRASLTPIQIPNLPLGLVTFPNGKAMNLNVGIGSGAFRAGGDAAGRIWLLTDRGPNLECADSKRLIGLEPEAICGADKNGRIYPLPGFAPSIYGIDIGPDNVGRINVFLPIKGRSGRPISGRPPVSSAPRGELIFAADGKPLPPDPSGIDPEAFVKLADGSFWVAEEFGPSLLHVGQDGTVLKRIVPAGTAAEFKDADYEIVAGLPAILRNRPSNRGFEGLALSPDERFLYAILQSPLANPDVDTFRRSRHVRLLKIERETGTIIGQFLYTIDHPAQFAGDADGRERKLSDVHVSELVAIGEDKLLVLERIEKTARLFSISLGEDNQIPALFDSAEKSPGLEAIAAERLEAMGVLTLPKTLILDTDSVPGLPAKIEGIAVLGPSELLMVNDNDFGIDGVRTQIFRVRLPEAMIR